MCHLSRQSPADPEKAGTQFSGLHLAPSLNTHRVCSLTFSPFMPTAPCGPWIPLLPCKNINTVSVFAMHIRITVPPQALRHVSSLVLVCAATLTTKRQGGKKHWESHLLCLPCLLPLQAVPEAPPRPASDTERIRMPQVCCVSIRVMQCALTGGPGIPAGPLIPL